MIKNYTKKAFISAVFTLAVVLAGSKADAQCLITTGPTNNCSFGDAVDNITINAVSVTNAGCSGTGTGYTYFPTPVWNFQLGASYPISLAVGGAQYNQGVRIWLDANGNGIFETTESVYNSTAAALTHTGTLVVPATGSTAAPVRMRVMCTYNTTPTNAQACNSNVGNYGETEDYQVQLTCNAPPAPTATSPVTICEGNSASLTVSSSPVGTINWYTSAVGGSPVGTGTSFTTPVLLANTSYYVCDSAPGCPGTRTQVDVVVNPVPVVSLGTPPVQCGGSITLDAGNPGSTYAWSNSQNTQTISVTASGTYAVTVTTVQGCTGTGMASVAIDPPSAAGSAVASANAYCQGSSVMLSTTGETGSISWVERAGSAGPFAAIGSGTTFTTVPMNTPGTYEYRAVATSGTCPDDSSSIISIMIDSASVAGSASSTAGSELCANGQILFMTTGNTGNIDWYVSEDNGVTWNLFGFGNPFDPGPPSNQDTGMYLFQAVAISGSCPADTSAQFAVTVVPSPEVALGNDTTFCGSSLMLDAGNPGDMYMWSTADSIQMITVVSTGTYSVDVTNSFGCITSDTIQVTINAMPVVDLGADSSYCNSTMLDAGNAGSLYSWNTGDSTQTITVLASGPYTVTVTGANGCTAWDSVNLTINQDPTVTFTSTVDSVCVTDAAVTLTGGSPAGGTYSGTAVSGGVFTPATAGAGTHTITYAFTDANGCSGSAMHSIVVDGCVGISDANAEGGIQLFPNPTNGELNIVYSSVNNSRIVVTIVNAAGQMIFEEEAQTLGNDYRTTIDFSREAKGLYLVRIQDGDTLVTERIIVE